MPGLFEVGLNDKLMDTATFLGTSIVVDSIKARKIEVNQAKLMEKGIEYLAYRFLLKDSLQQMFNLNNEMLNEFVIEVVGLSATEVGFKIFRKQGYGVVPVLTENAIAAASNLVVKYGLNLVMNRMPSNGLMVKSGTTIDPSQEQNQDSRVASGNFPVMPFRGLF